MLKPVYDHATGTLVRPEYVNHTNSSFVEGLLGFHTPTLRQFYDVKVYLSRPKTPRRSWKIKRDTTKRGYTTEQVLAELERREPDSSQTSSGRSANSRISSSVSILSPRPEQEPDRQPP